MGWLSKVVNAIVTGGVSLISSDADEMASKLVNDALLAGGQPVRTLYYGIFTKSEDPSTDMYKTGIGGFLGDVSKITVQPVDIAYSSITNDHSNDIKYSTDLGKFLGGVGAEAQNISDFGAKSFADTISGGYATKLGNVIRTDENKQTKYQYKGYGGGTGVEWVDNTAETLKKASTVIGSVAAAYASGGESSSNIEKAEKAVNAVAFGAAVGGYINQKPETAVIKTLSTEQVLSIGNYNIPAQINGIDTRLIIFGLIFLIIIVLLLR